MVKVQLVWLDMMKLRKLKCTSWYCIIANHSQSQKYVHFPLDCQNQVKNAFRVSCSNVPKCFICYLACL